MVTLKDQLLGATNSLAKARMELSQAWERFTGAEQQAHEAVARVAVLEAEKAAIAQPVAETSTMADKEVQQRVAAASKGIMLILNPSRLLRV